MTSGGAGLAKNKIGCMQNYNESFLPLYPTMYDITLYGKKVTSFSWQVGVGAYYTFLNHWRFGMAYRFVDVGMLTTGDYCTDTVNKLSGVVMAFIAKHPTFSELLLSLTYDF